MQAARRWGYYDGTNTRPSPAVDNKPTDAEKRAMATWDQEDIISRYLLSSHLPDTTALEVSDLGTAEERWTRVTQEYQAMSAYARHDLEVAFLEMRCPKGGDVRSFLTDLHFKRQKLAAACVKLDDRDYQRTVLCGIPGKLATFASALLSSPLTPSPPASTRCWSPPHSSRTSARRPTASRTATAHRKQQRHEGPVGRGPGRHQWRRGHEEETEGQVSQLRQAQAQGARVPRIPPAGQHRQHRRRQQRQRRSGRRRPHFHFHHHPTAPIRPCRDEARSQRGLRPRRRRWNLGRRGGLPHLRPTLILRRPTWPGHRLRGVSRPSGAAP